jgi:hypothetical protein
MPTNGPALAAFRIFVTELRQRTLRRRSQKDGMTWNLGAAHRRSSRNSSKRSWEWLLFRL